MRRITLVVMVLAFCTSICTGQTVLLDQQPNTSVEQVIDQEMPDFGEFSTFLLSDITLTRTTDIGGVTVYFTNSVAGLWDTAVTEARLSTFSDPIGNADPRFESEIVPVEVEVMGDLLAISMHDPLAKRLLPPGTHWIGLTPLAGADIPQEFRFAAVNPSGNNSIIRNPGGGFNIGTGWQDVGNISPTFFDAAITVYEGGVLTPPFYIDSLNVFRGIVVDGEFTDLFCDDDETMLFRPGFTINSSEAPVWLEFEGTNLAPNDYRDFVLNSSAGTPGITLTVEEWNWDTNSYEMIGEESENFGSFTVKEFLVTPYLNNQSKMRVRVGWRATGLTINFPWEIEIDSAFWFYAGP